MLYDTALALGANTAVWFSFDMAVMPDFASTADVTIDVFQVSQADSTVEATFGLNYVAASTTLAFGVGELAATAFDTANPIVLGEWYNIELNIHIDSGVGNDGFIAAYITRDGATPPTTAQIIASGFDQAATTLIALGSRNHGTAAHGTILFDNFRHDDARLYPKPRYRTEPVLTQSEHIFVGPGWIDGAAILSTGSDNVIRFFDTDKADTLAQEVFKLELDPDASRASIGPVAFKRGCFVQLTGTSPRVQVFMTQHSQIPGVLGPVYHNDANKRMLGRRR